MKRLPLCFFILVSVLFSNFSLSHAAAVSTTALQTESAELLTKLGVADTSKTSSKTLKSKIAKHEFISLMTRMLCYDQAEDLDAVSLPYKDVDKSHKAYNNIKIAYKHGIILDDKDSSLSPNGYITYVDALKMVLNGLGYSEDIVDLTAEDILKRASEMKISDKISLSFNKQLTYGEAYMILYNALVVDFN